MRYCEIDFAAVAAAMGVEAFVAESVDDVARILHGGWDHPRLVDARIDPTPYAA